MAPAAFHTIEQNLEDFQVNETWYDKIITGDLGEVGRTILLEFMKNKGRDLSQLHMDCGMEIYDKEQQDTHSGGSGCGCSAVTLCSYILPKVQDGTWKRVLFVPQVPCCPRSASMKDRAYRALPMQSSLNI